MKPTMRALVGLLAPLLVAGGLVVAAPPDPAEAAFAPPQFVRTISGNGRPGVFPWGAQFNPVSNEIVVGDYLNNQIRRYAPDGRILGSFYRPHATGQPYSLAVDPVNGDIYVPEIAEGRRSDKVAVYTKGGTYLREMAINSSDYIAWVTLDADRNLVVADSHYYDTMANPPVVNVYRTSDSRRLKRLEILPPGTTSSTVPRIYGIDVHPTTGDLWMTDTWNNRILRYSGDGAFRASYSLKGIVTSDARGMELDATRNRLYVSDGGGGQLEVFNLSGRHLRSLGEQGSTASRLSSPRQPAVAPDGSVYVSEYGSARVHRFSSAGADLGFFPEPGQPAVPGHLGEPRDVDVDDSTGEVWVADSWNQRFQKFGGDGSFLGTWGNRSSSPSYGMNYPRGIGVDPVNDVVWVANQRGHHIKRYDRQGEFVDQLGDALLDDEGVGHFRWPLDIEVDSPRSRVVVSDRNSSKVKILDAVTGVETGSITRPDNHAVAIDPATGNIYVANDKSSTIYLYNSTGTTLITTFGSAGSGDGQFRYIWDMTVVGDRLYVTDNTTAKISVFTLGGGFVGKWGGYGAGAYQFRNPSGIASDPSGKVYVADAGNDRVVVFDTTRSRGGGNWPPPSLTVAAPGNDASLSGQPVRLSGTATDETGVATVEIAVRNTATGQWFDASKSTWQATQTWGQAPYWGTSTRSVEFAWSFIGVEYGGSYQAVLRAVDASGNKSPESTRHFSILPKSTTDTSAPTTYMTSPQEGEVVPAGPLLTLAGQTGDDVAVATTEVSIRKVGANQWLRSDGTWGAFAWLPATLDDPGATSSAWRFPWHQPPHGDYVAQVRSTDVIGNTESQPLTRAFTVGAAHSEAPDVVAPGLTVTAPAAQTLSASDPAIRGTATDDVGVTTVEVAVKDRATGQWLVPGGGWAPDFGWVPATLTTPRATSTSWSLEWPGLPGDYGYQVRVSDAAGNVTSRSFSPFTVN